MDATIRRATAADHDRMAELDVLTWSPTSSPGPPPQGRNLFERRTPEDHLVAELADARHGGVQTSAEVSPDSRIIGYIVLGHPTPLASSLHVVEVQGLAVHPGHAGQGIGTALVAAAVTEARRRGARKVGLRVLGPNAVARRLYERAGFTVEGHLIGEFLLDGEPVDDLLMALHLT